jgi:hypothetical protein
MESVTRFMLEDWTGGRAMHRTIEAIVEADGSIRLLEPVERGAPRRALVTLLDEAPPDETFTVPLHSQDALADWTRAEEDEAWAHLQPAP